MNWKAIILLIAILFVVFFFVLPMMAFYSLGAYGWLGNIYFVAFIVIAIFSVWLYHHLKNKLRERKIKQTGKRIKSYNIE
jgi:protein-S-isoprenylcysteine O-methyltransferase Ste14